jgi:hypothetical protein
MPSQIFLIFDDDSCGNDMQREEGLNDAKLLKSFEGV